MKIIRIIKKKKKVRTLPITFCDIFPSDITAVLRDLYKVKQFQLFYADIC